MDKREAKDLEIDGVPYGEIKKRRNLIGTWRAFGFDNKEAFDAAEISDGRIVAHIKGVAFRKAKEEEAKAAEALEAIEAFQETSGEDVAIAVSNLEEFEARVEKRVAEYLEDFDTTVRSDIDNLANLAKAQLALERIQEIRMHQLAQPMEYQAMKTAKDALKILGDAEKSLLQQIRLLQKGMGIDKPTREAADSAETGVDRVVAIVEAAKKFLVNEVVQVHHCGIRIADWSDYFWETGLYLRKKCPRCGEMIEIEYPESEKDSFLEAVDGVANVVKSQDSV